MNHQPQQNADPDDAWLRQALRDDLALSPYIDDDGFSVRVVQRLPAAARLPWLDGLGLALVIGFVALALWPLIDAAATPLVHALTGDFVDTAHATVAVAGDQLSPLFGHLSVQALSLKTLLAVFAPLAALLAATAVLVEI